MRTADIPDHFPFKAKCVIGTDEWLNPGDSATVHPDGKFLAGPVRHQETILYAEVDPRQVHGPRGQLDVAGHYARPDVFTLTVDRAKRPMVRTLTEGKETDGAEAS